MKVGVLWSGGKDSTYAAWIASRTDELACFVTIFPRSPMSYMFHYPNVEWTRLQAEAAGVPQIAVETRGEKEAELDDLQDALAESKRRFAIEGVFTGALASAYQKTRVDRVCAKLGLHCISPLWGANPEEHLRWLVRDGFDAMLVSVSALGLDHTWLGRHLDAQSVEELVALSRRFRFHASLEGGEGETFVLDSPLFSKRVEVLSSAKHWRGDSGYLEIRDARLVTKPRQKGAAVGSRARGSPSSVALL